jgi:hypothetical protein
MTFDKPVTERTVLDEARILVDGARQKDYGSPDICHSRTALLWSAYLNTEVTARDVCMMNILQKVSRDSNASKRDNLVDICGYARCAEILE